MYNVGTVPGARGKGYAAQIMDALIQASAGSASINFLQVEKSGPAEALYQKLGFKALFSRSGYQLKSWKPRLRSTTAAVTPALAALLGGDIRQSVGVGSFSKEIIPLPPELISRLKAISAKQNLEPQVYFSGALAALWMRYSGEETATFTLATESGPAMTVNLSPLIETRAQKFL